MNENYILIYGFGWTGKNVLYLCECLNCSCKIMDDNLDLSSRKDDRFVNMDFIKHNPPALCLISISGKSTIFQRLKKQLMNANIKSQIIKSIAVDGFHAGLIKLFKNEYISGESFINRLLRDDENLNDFSATYRKIVSCYLESKKRDKQRDKDILERYKRNYQDRSVFSNMYETAMNYTDKGVLYYPGFHIWTDGNSEDKNFFFREKIDFKALKNRSKNTKIIAILGPSTVQESYLPLEDTLCFQVSNLINRQIVTDNYAGGGDI